MTLVISRTQHSHDPQPSPTVEQVQMDLIRRGYSVGPSGADGVFGAYSEGAVIRFQKRHGLRVDGQVGRDTWKALQHRGLIGTAERAADIAYRRVTGTDGHPVPHYRFGVEVTNLAEKYPSAFDCSELVQWAVFQATTEDWRDGSANQAAACHLITASAAVKVKGALLFESYNGHPSGVHHVAFSMGDGWTAEARSRFMSPECGSWKVQPGRFSFGGLATGVLSY